MIIVPHTIPNDYPVRAVVLCPDFMLPGRDVRSNVLIVCRFPPLPAVDIYSIEVQIKNSEQVSEKILNQE